VPCQPTEPAAQPAETGGPAAETGGPAAETGGAAGESSKDREGEIMDDHVSVLVIGGGPAGSTAAALLAKSGVQVRLLERETFPRYHIGESLLPSCLSILRLSGAFDEVAKHGFQIKRGGVFLWKKDKWLLDWSELIDSEAWSWQVDRASYDNILLRNAATQGTEVIEGATVKDVQFDGDRPVSVSWTDGQGTVHHTGFDFLIDASGRAGVLSRQHFAMRRPHEVFQNVAVWSYWEGAHLLPGGPEGAIDVLSDSDGEGWFWHIPLSSTRYSVGYVTHKQCFAERRPKFTSLNEYYQDALDRTPDMRGLLDGAAVTTRARAEQDYSYVSDRFCGPGYVMVGDAVCFLDPLLSTGVHLAQYGALVGAAAVATTLRGEMDETESLTFFDYVYRRAYSRFLVLVSRMYRQYVGMDEYFSHAHDLTVHEDSQEAIQSFTRITTGLTDVREARETGTRTLTETLIREAEDIQDEAAKSNVGFLGGLDMSHMWNVWENPLGPDTAMGNTHITTTPRFGLVHVAT
jgi:flavin-dependent dehydrogenase